MTLEVFLAAAQANAADPISKLSHELRHPLTVLAVEWIVQLDVRRENVHAAFRARDEP